MNTEFFKPFITCIQLEYAMEGSNKSPWSRKRKLEAKMQRLWEAKRNKLHSASIDSNASSSVAGPSEPVTESPEVPELSVSTFIYGVIG